MKFLIFSPYYPPHTGGLESHSEEFNKELASLGHRVTVFTPALPHDALQEEVSGDIHIIRYPAFEIVPNYPLPRFWRTRFWKQLFSLQAAARPEIVITRTRFFLLSFIGLLFAKKHHVPCVHIEHGSDFVKLSSPFSSFIAYLYDHTFGRIVFCFSTLNISISEAVQIFVKKFDSRFSPIIYRGLNFSQLDTAEVFHPEALNPYSGKLILTTAARLYKWKGIERTLNALRSLPSRIQDRIVFVIIGDGEDRKRLEVLAQDLPVVFLGRLSRQNTIGFLKKSDIYIHSSYPGGGLSTSLLEALYCSCAVISTLHEGANEIIHTNENGILLHDEEFQSAITLLVSDPELRTKLAENARISILQKFSWAKSIDQYLTCFKNL